MRRSSVVQVVQVGRRGVLDSLVGGAFELGILALKWAFIATVVAMALMVVGAVCLVRWVAGKSRDGSVIRWRDDIRGFWYRYR
jgi:hypothetical protein